MGQVGGLPCDAVFFFRVFLSPVTSGVLPGQDVERKGRQQGSYGNRARTYGRMDASHKRRATFCFVLVFFVSFLGSWVLWFFGSLVLSVAVLPTAGGWCAAAFEGWWLMGVRSKGAGLDS